MKIPRKDLTRKQKNDICKKYKNENPDGPCTGCPLFEKYKDTLPFCYRNIDELDLFIDAYWNDEIEVEK